MTKIKMTVYAVAFVAMLVFLLGIMARWYSKKPQNSFFIPVISQFNTEEKVVALTFDDGPSAVNTPPLLALLKKYDVKASFVVIGERLEKHMNIARQIKSAGHQLANHSYTHPHLVFMSKDAILEEIEMTENLLNQSQLTEHSYFRAPYGDKFINLPLVLKEKGMKLIAWNVESHQQYQEKMDSDLLANETIKQCRPGSIILLHDGFKDQKEDLLKTVEKIIIELQKREYTFVTVHEGLKYVK